MSARGFWRKQEQNREPDRERTRGGKKRGKNRKTIDERFNRGLPSSRNRADFKRMHFSREPWRNLAFIKICIEARASQRRDEIPFRGRNEIENDEFFLEKERKREREKWKKEEEGKKKECIDRTIFLAQEEDGGKMEGTGGNWRRVDKFAARAVEMFNIG